MKGIITAGGLGTRLQPVTQVVSKHILLVYDKPMIYYPLTTLMSAGIREIAIISTTRDINMFKGLLGDGSHLGIRIEYAVQQVPRGVADAFIVASDFIGRDSAALILGDNIFIDDENGTLKSMMQNAIKKAERDGGVIFTKEVANPSSFGVAELDENGRAISIEEKPSAPKSRNAIAGLYFYDNKAVRLAKGLSPSARGEIEIRDINRDYMRRGRLEVMPLTDGIVWQDAGTAEALLSIGNIVSERQRKSGRLIGSIEEEAYINGWITKEDVNRLSTIIDGDYGRYLERI